MLTPARSQKRSREWWTRLFGKRPFRVHIDPSEDGAEIVNGVRGPRPR